LIESHSVDRTRVAVLRQATPDDFVFRNVDGISPEDQLTLLYLSFSIWTAINAISTSFTPNTAINSAAEISATFLRLQSTHKKKAAMRNKLKNQKKKDFLLLYNALPESLRIFTDGSSCGRGWVHHGHRKLYFL